MPNTEQLNPEFLTRLNEMIAASGGTIGVVSAYRSEAEQEALWAKALAKYGDPEVADNWVARPPSAGGTGGNHMKGIAVDLQFADDEARVWAHEHAAEFGLHFPMEWEPWHVEPLGSRDVSTDADYTTPPAGHVKPTQRPMAFGEAFASILDLLRNPALEAAATGFPLQGQIGGGGGGEPAFGSATVTGTTAPVGGDEVSRLMAVMSGGLESSGDPSATNPRTGAHGLFQIMPGNWSAWAQEAGLPADAPQTAENQRAVAHFKLSQYRDQFGSIEAAAVAWFAGPDDGAAYAAGDMSVLTKSDGNKTVEEYIADVRQGMAA